MKDRATYKDRWGLGYCYIVLAVFCLFLAATVIPYAIVSKYDSSAVVTAVGNEGVTIEYRDRHGTLKSDFMETANEYNIGDRIVVHVDEFTYRAQNRVLLIDANNG